MRAWDGSQLATIEQGEAPIGTTNPPEASLVLCWVPALLAPLMSIVTAVVLIMARRGKKAGQ